MERPPRGCSRRKSTSRASSRPRNQRDYVFALQRLRLRRAGLQVPLRARIAAAARLEEAPLVGAFGIPGWAYAGGPAPAGRALEIELDYLPVAPPGEAPELAQHRSLAIAARCAGGHDPHDRAIARTADEAEIGSCLSGNLVNPKDAVVGHLRALDFLGCCGRVVGGRAPDHQRGGSSYVAHCEPQAPFFLRRCGYTVRRVWSGQRSAGVA